MRGGHWGWNDPRHVRIQRSDLSCSVRCDGGVLVLLVLLLLLIKLLLLLLLLLVLLLLLLVVVLHLLHLLHLLWCRCSGWYASFERRVLTE